MLFYGTFDPACSKPSISALDWCPTESVWSKLEVIIGDIWEGFGGQDVKLAIFFQIFSEVC